MNEENYILWNSLYLNKMVSKFGSVTCYSNYYLAELVPVFRFPKKDRI